MLSGRPVSCTAKPVPALEVGRPPGMVSPVGRAGSVAHSPGTAGTVMNRHGAQPGLGESLRTPEPPLPHCDQTDRSPRAATGSTSVLFHLSLRSPQSCIVSSTPFSWGVSQSQAPSPPEMSLCDHKGPRQSHRVLCPRDRAGPPVTPGGSSRPSSLESTWPSASGLLHLQRGGLGRVITTLLRSQFVK